MNHDHETHHTASKSITSRLHATFT
jgi:hypothetical protein